MCVLKKLLCLTLSCLTLLMYCPAGVSAADADQKQSPDKVTVYEPQASTGAQKDLPEKKGISWYWYALGVVVIAGGVAAAAGGGGGGDSGGGGGGATNGNVITTW